MAIFTFAGFAGTSKGSFFKAPAWVDLSKPPGHTSQDASYCPSPDWWMQAYSGYYLLFSPNIVWLVFALTVYVLAPYDIDAAGEGFAWDWIAWRALVNLSLVFGYVSFWHVALYFGNAASRPYKPNRTYRWGKLAHNAFYNVLACLQWTAWEVLMMRAWGTGRLPYLADAEVLGTRAGAINFIASIFWVPLWRSWHFYFAHRFLHFRPMYRFVHSLHHRNTDIEPFAGLCMHPVEHLYYFTCAGPSLLLFVSPFAFMWNGVHLLLSPAASHSGYEDHFQSDQFHYLHHRYFECNYGPSDCPLDRWFGTFRDKFEPKRAGDSAQAAAEQLAVVTDAKATLLGPPEASFVSYLTLSAAVPWAVLTRALLKQDVPAPSVWSSLFGHPTPDVSPWPLPESAPAIAALVATGPVLVAMVLVALGDPKKFMASPRFALMAPFHKERLFGALGLHLVMACFCTVLPVFYLVHTVLAPVGDSAYCHLMGGC